MSSHLISSVCKKEVLIKVTLKTVYRVRFTLLFGWAVSIFFHPWGPPIKRLRWCLFPKYKISKLFISQKSDSTLFSWSGGCLLLHLRPSAKAGFWLHPLSLSLYIVCRDSTFSLVEGILLLLLLFFSFSFLWCNNLHICWFF